MTTYVLYHGNCPDGTGAALAAWLIFRNDAHYIPVNYGQPLPDIVDGARVFIVDFSYPREVLESLAARTNLTVLDHHATAQHALAGLPYCTFDMNKSGAVLAWEHFHQRPPPPFFLYLQDRDLWRFELPKSREVSAAIGSYPLKLEVWSKWFEGENPDAELIELFAAEGRACLRLKNQQVDNMCQHARMMWFSLENQTVYFGIEDFPIELKCVAAVEWNWSPIMGGSEMPTYAVAPAANATVFFSEVGERLLELHPSAQFAAYYLDRSDGKRQWGLRSRPTFDCSVIAKAMGGGGHKQAAGFLTDHNGKALNPPQ